MTTAMTNNGAGISGFLGDLNLDPSPADPVETVPIEQQAITDSTGSETMKANDEPESYVLLLIDASSHLVRKTSKL